MNPEWLCYVNGQEYGPYTWPQLVQMAQAGNVVPQTHVRRNFDSQWYTAEQVPGLFAAPAAPATSPKKAAHPAIPAARPATGSGTKKALSKSGPQPLPEAAPSQPALPPAAAAPVAAAGVPKGRVISKAPSAVAPAANKPIPLQSIATAPNVAPSVAFAAKTESDSPITPARKTDSAKQMVLYLGGAIVGVALLGGLALIWKFTRPPEEPKEVAAAPVIVPTAEADPNVISEEVDPTEEAVTSKPAAKGTDKAGAKTGAKPEAGKAKTTEPASPTMTLVKSVAAWKPIEKFGSVRISSGLSCTKMSAYLAADEKGRRVAVRMTGGAPASPTADNAAAASVAAGADGSGGETPAIIAPSPAPAPGSDVKYAAAEAAPFLFVELSITNKDTTKPLTYGGWNSKDTAAVLVDASGKPFTLHPVATARKATEIKPGETIQDTIAFDLPPNAALQFRLALPQTAFSPKLKGAWGYEIGGAYLAASSQVGPDGAPVAAPPVRRTLGIPIPGVHDEPMPQPAPAPAPVPPTPAQPAPAQPAAEPEMKKAPTERIPIPGLSDVPDKPAPPKSPDEVPNLAPPTPKKK